MNSDKKISWDHIRMNLFKFLSVYLKTISYKNYKPHTAPLIGITLVIAKLINRRGIENDMLLLLSISGEFQENCST